MNYQQPKIQDLFSKSFRILLTGQSQCGKSELLLQLITNQKYGIKQRFKADQIYLISPTLQIDNAQQSLIEYLENHQCNPDQQYFPEDQLISDLSIANNVIQNIYDSQKEVKVINKQNEKEGKKLIPYYEKLIILDDIIGNSEFKTTKNSLLDKLIVKARHVDINMIILSQYFKSISSVIRANITHFIFFNIPMHSEIHKIKDEVSGQNKKIFDEVYNDATSQPYSALLILQQLPTNYKYFKIYDKDKIQQYNLN